MSFNVPTFQVFNPIVYTTLPGQWIVSAPDNMFLRAFAGQEMLVYDHAIKGLAPVDPAGSEDDDDEEDDNAAKDKKTRTAHTRKRKKRTPPNEKMKKAAMKVKIGVGGSVAVVGSSKKSSSVIFGDGTVAHEGDIVLVAKADYTIHTAVLGGRQDGNTFKCCVFVCVDLRSMRFTCLHNVRRSMDRFRP